MAWECQRLLLFIIYLDDHGNDADDQNAELEQIGICDHVHHPPPVKWRRKQEEVQPPPEGGAPPTATGSAWVDYSILCRIWQDTGTDCHVGALPLLAMTGPLCNKVTPMLHLCYIWAGALDFGFGV